MWNSAYLFLLAQLGATTSTSTGLDLSVQITPVVLDYELPGHVNMLGRGHIGLLTEADLNYQPNKYVRIGAGILGRAPFALTKADYADAIGRFYIEGRPLGHSNLIMRFGSLLTDHGFHPALVDEARYSISRNIKETYNRSIPNEAHRDHLPQNAMPAEHGAQIIYEKDSFRGEVFLDWQLLETDSNREKFNFGALAQFDSYWLDLALQFRLTHYGGQIFTQGDPIRFAQLDPVRQPESLALTLTLHALRFENLTLNILTNVAAGHMRQKAGGEEAWHYGAETGLESVFYEHVILSYQYWWSKDGQAGLISEDSDPGYNQGPTHRIRIGVLQKMGGLTIDGGLFIILAQDAPEKIQYLAITHVSYRFFHKLF